METEKPGRKLDFTLAQKGSKEWRVVGSIGPDPSGDGGWNALRRRIKESLELLAICALSALAGGLVHRWLLLASILPPCP